MAVPEELGGRGFTLAEVCREQRRLAYHAPATAHRHQHAHLLDGRRRRPVALRGSHAGMAVARRGRRRSLRRRSCRAGQRFPGAALDSRAPSASTAATGSTATNSSAASRRSGHFSASMRWTPATPPRRRWCTRLCHAILRATPSSRHGTRSACAPPERRYHSRWGVRSRSLRRTHRTAGASGVDQFVLGVFAWALLGFANVYYGIAQRASISRLKASRRRSRSR